MQMPAIMDWETFTETYSFYLEGLDCRNNPGDIVFKATPAGKGRWTLVISTCYRQGLLALVLGLLATNRVSVRQGRFCNNQSLPVGNCGGSPIPSQQSLPANTNKKIVAVFTVILPKDCLDAETIFQNLENDLRALIKQADDDIDLAREKVVDALSIAVKDVLLPHHQLLPINIQYDNNHSESATALHIISEETPGYLFALTNALAMLGIKIESGEINSSGKDATLTLWIVDSMGRKICDPVELNQLKAASAVIKQFTHLLPLSADPALAIRQFKEFVEHILRQSDWLSDLESFKFQDVMNTLAQMMGVSQFLWNDFLRMQHENLFPLVRDPANLERLSERDELVAKLNKGLRSVEGTEEKAEVINSFKDREMFRIDLMHITRRITDITFSRKLTELTDVIVSQIAALCYDHLVQKFGHPRLENGDLCNFSVLAVGKFGGLEMGFASDIELLFVYEGSGESDGENGISNSLFFEKLAQLFLKSLKSRHDGIFEIDMRLRPHGGKGTLASSLNAFAEYYSLNGAAEHFERLALVKLRPITGPEVLINKIFAARDAFVFSGQPVDYKNIRYFRERQIQELAKGKKTHAKYSAGGLVDLEYYIQALQLKHGEYLKAVRESNTIIALTRLEQAGLVSVDQSTDIRLAYQCLRRLIEALRVVRGNAKDMTIPEVNSKTFRYLARRMGYDSSTNLKSALEKSMDVGISLWQV